LAAGLTSSAYSYWGISSAGILHDKLTPLT